MRIFIILSFGILISCTPKINYSLISVAEESSLKLTQYSKETDRLSYPFIGKDKSSGQLIWYAPPILAVSPDDKKIAYTASSNGFGNIYLKDISGGLSIIQRTFNKEIMDMAYSPDGKYIAFTERKLKNDNIYMINATEGGAIQQLVSSSAAELSPAFSPDGKNLFFTKSEGDRYFIWSLNLESSLLTQYTEGFTPCLTPNGTELVVTRNSRDGSRGEIWMINLQKSTETLILSDNNRGFSSPQISPDGKKILCVGTTERNKTKNQNLDLYTINIDGTKLTQLTFHQGHDVSPIWTHDGKSIFFLSQRGNKSGRYNLWKMDYNNL
ncbi:MAG TPA: hypothetical protein VK590_11665 [Saprospiraceae bacterium]|nr:hypothetical protein [Saprospiraceae bacterium]